MPAGCPIQWHFAPLSAQIEGYLDSSAELPPPGAMTAIFFDHRTPSSFWFAMTIRSFAWVVLFSLSATPLCAAPPIPHAQDKPPGPALSPTEALAHMKVPPGFSVELVASEPDLVNPVAMCFDEQGRIWVCESVEYPRRSPGKGKDRIKVFEDTDHDGKADKVTLFADGLNIPSGIAVGHGGVWVANSPDILFMQDFDGDLKVDKTEVVVTGFGRSDTHELPNSLVWGPDGWLYGLNGVFNESRVKYRGKEHVFTCAMFRIHPRTRDFELFAEGTSNPWGIAFDHEGSAFVSACVIDHFWHIVQSGYYHRQGGPYPPHTWKIESIVKHKHQKAAYCGLTFFDSDAYPPAYRGKMYMGNIHGNCVNVDAIRREGSTYFATGEPDFLTADDAWFMPVSQKTGPDGCLYVLDWYDQYHCYQDANRDPEGIERAKGRLYRVRYKETPRAPEFNLAKETDQQLIERLGSPNIYFRETAHRILVERNSAASRAELETLVLNGKTPAKTRAHAQWALGSNGLPEATHAKLLSHSEPSVRAFAVRVAGNQKEVSPAIAKQIAALATDPSPDVRLQVAIASVRVKGLDPITILVAVLDASSGDVLIPNVVWQNLHPLLPTRGAEFVKTWNAGTKRSKDLTEAIAPRAFERLLSAPEVSAQVPVDLVASLRDAAPVAAQQCLARLAARVQTGELRDKRLEEFKQALEPTLKPLLQSTVSHPAELDAALLAVSWKDPRGLPAVRQTFRTAGLDPELRLRALQALVATGDTGILESAGAALTTPIVRGPRTSPETAAAFPGQVLAALGRLEDPKVAEVVLEAFPKLPPEIQPRAVELLTQRAVWAKQLLVAIGEKKLPAESLNQNQVRKLLATRDKELIAAVSRHWGTIREGRNPDRDAQIAEFRAEFRKNPGDPHRGQEAFKKVCGQCHKMYGQGEEVGPDITSNGRSSFDQLVSNVFDPSLVIGAAFQARTILTKSGRVVTGLVVEDTPERVVLKLQGGKLEAIPRDEIEEEKNSELSLMPEDLERTLKPQELLDLFAFITLDRPPTDSEAKPIPGLRDTSPRDVTEPALFGSILVEVAPGFTTSAVGERGLGLLRSYAGRERVMRTHPVDEKTPCVLTRNVTVPSEGETRLKVSASHDRTGDWRLLVKANDDTLVDQIIGPESSKGGWTELEVDLSKYAGQKVKLSLHNVANNWSNEFAYWGRVEVVTGK